MIKVIPLSDILMLSAVGLGKGTSGADDVVKSAAGCTRLWILLTISSMQTNATDRP